MVVILCFVEFCLPCLSILGLAPTVARLKFSMAGRATVLHIDVASSLTSKERKIFNILLDTVRCYRGKTVLRVAGGWVRDKLLGLESDDVDIALDDTNGSAFANLANSYMEQHSLPTHHVGIIAPNPKQSKHLETARMRVEESWIDFVNLRTEVLSQLFAFQLFLIFDYSFK